MRISDFDYDLPEARIAQFPPEQRGQTRLLVLDRQTGAIEHRRYPDVIEYLSEGDVVVLNNTKVIKARLLATNAKGQTRELLLIESHGKSSPRRRTAIYRGKITEDEVLMVGPTPVTIKEVMDGGLCRIQAKYNLLELAEDYGNVPLPPYLKRQATPEDQARYQTVFAKKSGSVAAPTASLNFTDELAKKLRAKGVKIVYLTLHVGLGTFLPIRTDKVEEHQMHSEYFEIPDEAAEAINQAKAAGRKVCAVGTTVARTLEYAAEDIAAKDASVSGEADIFIYPGYRFQLVDLLLTNFHAPRSTVLMLAAAFADWDHLEEAYQAALAKKYDFLSYGDSMLIH